MGGICGTVNVPLDRKRPDQGQIGIYFELYPHFGSGPAESAILAKVGPGITTSGLRWWFGYLFNNNLDKHDLLLIDDRGRGLSGAIDCPDLQHGTAPHDQSVAECAAQLGGAASRYGTGDIAQDTDDVRAALGYDKIDYYGGSYGGMDAAAYATRFGLHVRSLVLDSPIATPPEEFAFERYRTMASPRMVRLVCERSPNCAIDHPFPDLELNALIQTLRLHPIEGDAYDAYGNLKHVRVDEGNLLTHIIINPLGNMTNIGEVLAAGAALKQGDPKPLLRLEAEGYWTVQAESGDATFVSQGAKAASMAADFQVPWNWQTPVWQREEAYSRAVDKLPDNWFWPFSKQAATRPEIDFIHGYLNWEEPSPFLPGVSLHATFPNVPTLVLSGDLDNWCGLEESRKVAAQFPGSTYVSIAGSGHGTAGNSQCAFGLVSRFIETLEAGDVSCAGVPDVVYPAVGTFPSVAAMARPAAIDPGGMNQIGTAERKVVTMAVATAIDALQRGILGWGDGVGLRGGTFHTDYGSPWITQLSDSRFAQDVTVNGTVLWGADRSLDADLVVSGSGTVGGSLHVEGTWQAPGPVGNFKVTGTLGGKQVSVLVPEA
jgi:pimeloyl-ACP methyl ester carboxylesterase